MGAYIWRGDLTEGFLRYEFGGLIFGGAYTWRGLFSEFSGSLLQLTWIIVGMVWSMFLQLSDVKGSFERFFRHLWRERERK